jgi:hypothetical protein
MFKALNPCALVYSNGACFFCGSRFSCYKSQVMTSENVLILLTRLPYHEEKSIATLLPVIFMQSAF